MIRFSCHARRFHTLMIATMPDAAAADAYAADADAYAFHAIRAADALLYAYCC